MAVSDVMERISKAPLAHKAIGLALVGGLIIVGFYFSFYSELSAKLSKVEKQITSLKTQITRYEEKKQKYMAFRAEVNRLLEEQKELIKVLPSKAEIPHFLQAIHAQGELAGLTILTFLPAKEQKQKFYARIPVQMKIAGTYHQITKFFHSIGQMKRIVNINNLKLLTPKMGDQGVMLRADFLASTFRFLAPSEKTAPSKKSRRKKRRGRKG